MVQEEGQNIFVEEICSFAEANLPQGASYLYKNAKANALSWNPMQSLGWSSLYALSDGINVPKLNERF